MTNATHLSKKQPNTPNETSQTLTEFHVIQQLLWRFPMNVYSSWTLQWPRLRVGRTPRLLHPSNFCA